MSVTKISWTGTRMREPLTLSRALRLDDKVVIPAGAHPAGSVLPGFTFNPWLGCQRVSEACRNCYAEAWAKRAGYTPDGRHRLTLWGPPSTTPRVRTSAAYWKRPLQWNKVAYMLGTRLKVFCASLADVGEDHPMAAPWRMELFALIERTPCLDWLLLTKRPDVLRAAWPWEKPRPGVWVGATMEDQDAADRRAWDLLKIPAVTHFASVEPMLGPVDLDRYAVDDLYRAGRATAHMRSEIDWVIIGGESGPGHRPLDLGAAERLAAQARRTPVGRTAPSPTLTRPAAAEPAGADHARGLGSIPRAPSTPRAAVPGAGIPSGTEGDPHHGRGHPGVR